MAKTKDVKSNKPAATKPATVKKIIESPHPEIPEKAEISIDGCDLLYQELRIENKLTDEKGNEVKMNQRAHIDVTLEADPEHTTPKH
jgi:hypothetical protein